MTKTERVAAPNNLGGHPMLTLTLRSVGNPDFRQDASRPLPGVPTMTLRVDDFAQASRAAQQYIRENDLGGGNFPCAPIVDDDTGQTVGYIAYNGTIWTRPIHDWWPGDKPLFAPL